MGGVQEGISFELIIEGIKDTLVAIINWNASLIPECSHLWYIFSYITVILWFPLLRVFARDKFARKWAMGIMLLSVIINDIQQLYVLPIGKIVTYSVIGESIFFVLLGYGISEYFKSQEFDAKKIRIIGILGYLGGNLLRYILQIVLFAQLGEYANEYYLGTLTLGGIIAAAGLFMFINSFVVKKDVINNVFIFLGNNTYYIYLFHWIIKDCLITAGFNIWLYNRLNDLWLGNVMYVIVYTGLIFLICLIISVVLKKIAALLRCLWNKIVVVSRVGGVKNENK